MKAMRRTLAPIIQYDFKMCFSLSHNKRKEWLSKCVCSYVNNQEDIDRFVPLFEFMAQRQMFHFLKYLKERKKILPTLFECLKENESTIAKLFELDPRPDLLKDLIEIGLLKERRDLLVFLNDVALIERKGIDSMERLLTQALSDDNVVVVQHLINKYSVIEKVIEMNGRIGIQCVQLLSKIVNVNLIACDRLLPQNGYLNNYR